MRHATAAPARAGRCPQAATAHATLDGAPTGRKTGADPLHVLDCRVSVVSGLQI